MLLVHGLGCMAEQPKDTRTFLLAGALAGLCVDATLLPLDTVKTRLQSRTGWRASGGLQRLWAGLPAVLIGSAPGSAVFFATYEALKMHSLGSDASKSSPWRVAVCSSIAETLACVVRVPFETVKQRMQVGMSAFSAISGHGVSGLYRGLFATLQREIPFAMIQFPLYETLKQQSHAEVSGWTAALYGSLAGGITAALTTPLDVLKTRAMLAQHIPSTNTFKALACIGANEGLGALFAGVVPRVLWISVGGFVFFGVYEQSKGLLGSLY